nr:MAG TPA: hypothetical protein [Caudoviricetes sp.]
MHLPVGCLVKYIIAKYTKMSNSKNRPSVTSTRTAHISGEIPYKSHLYCIIFGDSLQETGCLFCIHF